MFYRLKDLPEVCVEQTKERHIFLKEDTKRGWHTKDESPTNLLIEGENYQALRMLEFTHSGKIDVIYIDPPYNTGNKDFVYDVDFSSDAPDSDEDIQCESCNTVSLKYVDVEDAFRHSKWVSFMERRLRIARNLLSNRGLIFISIDDHEMAHLKLLCDAVFGEENRLSIQVVVNHLAGRGDAHNFVPVHEYCLVYAKEAQDGLIKGREMTEDEASEYCLKDDISRYKIQGLRYTGAKDGAKEDRPNMYYAIYYNPLSKDISLAQKEGYVEVLPLKTDGSKGRWRWGKDTFLDNYKTEVVVKQTGSKWNAYYKMRDLVNGQPRTRKFKSLMMEPHYSTTTSADEIKKLFGSSTFDYAKPLGFIKDIVRSATNKDSIVLDFFAGSGTTGQAVQEINREDDGTRSFILVTNNQKSDKLPNGIARDVTYPRLQKTIASDTNLVYMTVAMVKHEKDSSTSAKIEQLAIKNRMLPLLKVKYNTYIIVKETEKYIILKNNNGFHLGVYFNTLGPTRSLGPIRAQFESMLEEMSDNYEAVYNCSFSGYASAYYNMIQATNV
jgi:adenine-specific DNA-methyltransferase